MIYDHYSGILGKFVDEGIITHNQAKSLLKNYLNTGILQESIMENLPEHEAVLIIDFIAENSKNFREKHGFKV